MKDQRFSCQGFEVPTRISSTSSKGSRPAPPKVRSASYILRRARPSTSLRGLFRIGPVSRRISIFELVGRDSTSAVATSGTPAGPLAGAEVGPEAGALAGADAGALCGWLAGGGST